MRKAYQQNQNISYIAGNIQSIFLQWFNSFFDPEYFKLVRFTSESDFIKFKGFMKEFTKHPKPFLVVSADINLVEDSIYTTGYQNKANSIDGISVEDKLFTSESILLLPDETAELLIRRSRYRFQFNLLMVESSIIKQFDLYNNIINNFRNKSKFAIDRKIQNVIPTRYIEALARNLQLDFKTTTFLKELNKHSEYPIIRKKTIKGDYVFYMLEDNMIQITIPDIPSKDSADQNNMIVSSARVTHIVEFEVTIPSEFILLIDELSPAGSTKLAKIYSPDMLIFIPPFENINVDAPVVFNNKTKIEQVDIVIEDITDYSVNIIDIFESDGIRNFIQTYLDAALPLSFLDFKVWKNSLEIPLLLDSTKTKIVLEPNLKEAYCITAYIDKSEYHQFTAQNSTSRHKTDTDIVYQT